jgi:hypothetical protein
MSIDVCELQMLLDCRAESSYLSERQCEGEALWMALQLIQDR